jgi:hypothetical protein
MSNSSKEARAKALDPSGTERGFYVAPFGPDGELLDVGFWAEDTLSSEWLSVCDASLDHAIRDSQRHSWGAELGRIETRVTARSGAALVTFYVDQVVVLSSALLSGRDEAREAEVIALFVETLRSNRLVQLAAGEAATTAFEQVRSVQQRPLAVVVVWHPDSISDDDMGVVRDLALHLAWAFFSREARAV